MAKARLRVGDIRLLGQSLSTRVYMCNCSVTPLYLYKARCANIPRNVLGDYNQNVQRITRAPWQSIPSTLMFNLASMGFPLRVRDLRVEGRLAMCRAAYVLGVFGRPSQEALAVAPMA